NTHKFVVTEEEAHSWPEVYFPNYGWLPFEPSGYRPPIVRPEESVAPVAGGPADCYDYGEYGDYGQCSDDGDTGDLGGILPGPPSAPSPIGVYQPASRFEWERYAVPIGGLLLVVAAGYWLLSRFGSRAVSTRDAVRGTYRQMTFLGALFGLRRKPSQTPLE